MISKVASDIPFFEKQIEWVMPKTLIGNFATYSDKHQQPYLK